MKTVQASFVFTIIVLRRAIAIPQLVVRQGGESLFDPFLDELGAAALGAAEGVWRLVNPPDQAPPENKSPQPAPEQAPVNPTPEESTSNPESVAPSSLPSVKNQCGNITPKSEQDSDEPVHVSIVPI